MRSQLIALVVSMAACTASAGEITLFAVDVAVDPNVTPGFSLSETMSGTASYAISALRTNSVRGGEPLANIQIEFASSVFSTEPHIILLSENADAWDIDQRFSLGAWRITFQQGPYLQPGDTIVMTIAYALHAPAAELGWDGDGPWEQRYLANDPINRTIISTSRLVPEPTEIGAFAGLAAAMLASIRTVRRPTRRCSSRVTSGV